MPAQRTLAQPISSLTAHTHTLKCYNFPSPQTARRMPVLGTRWEIVDFAGLRALGAGFIRLDRSLAALRHVAHKYTGKA